MRLFLASLIGLALFATLGTSLAGASESAETKTSSPHLKRILERGELRVGLTGNQPPLNMRNKNGAIIGLEVDLMDALALAMGLNVRLVTKPFAELLPALDAGEVDLVISGMTITPERNARFAFAGPYFISGKSLLTKSDAIATVERASTLDDPTRTYAALAGSTSEAFVKEMLPKAKLASAANYDDGVKAVVDDEVDALIADFPICQVSMLRQPDAGLKTLETPFTVEPLGIALPADDPLFVNLMQNYLNTMEGTGMLTGFKAKWFGGGGWLDELP